MGKTESSATIQANEQKLLDAGVSQDFINRVKNSGYGGLARGVNINTWDVKPIVDAWKDYMKISPELQARIDALPDVIKNDPSFTSLTPDMQEIAVYNYEIQKSNDAQKAQALATALEMATQQSDPYWKNILLIAQDEVLRGFEATQGDYQSSLERQQRIIQNINQDLTSNKDYLTLEQQNELANLSSQYKVQQENIIQGAANQGLTFSTKRKLAEQRLNEQNQGMVESTNRQYNKQLTDLQTQAQRGEIEAQKAIEDLQRKAQEQTTALGRQAEQYMGTSNLPSLPGYTPLGTSDNQISGQMYEDKVRDIEVRKNALYDELTQSSLQY